MASLPMVIRETGSPGRVIILRGRSLPYRRPNWTGEHRVELDWFPGNPIANANVLGPIYTPSTFKGRWSDRWLRQGKSTGTTFDQGFGTFIDLGAVQPNEHSPQLIGFPPLASGPISLTRSFLDSSPSRTVTSAQSVRGSDIYAERAMVVVDAFEMIRRSGVRLKVEWSSIARYGFLTNLTIEPDREEDIYWEMTFTWDGDAESFPRPRKKQGVNAIGLIRKIADQYQALVDQLILAEKIAYGKIRQLNQTIKQLGSLTSALVKTLDRFSQLATSPVDLFGTVKQQILSVVLAIQDVTDSLRSVPSSYASIATGRGVIGATLDSGIEAAILRNMLILAQTAAEAARQIDEVDSGDVQHAIIVPEDTTLHRLSTQAYGSPDGWRKIARFNNLTSSTVPRGTVIAIPKK